MKRVFLDVDRDTLTGLLQLSINSVSDDGTGGGYRLGGPKYTGMSERLMHVRVDARSAAEIRHYLDLVAPEEPTS